VAAGAQSLLALPRRKHEGVMLAECRDLGVGGIAEYVTHGEGDPPATVQAALGQLCVDAAVALHLQWRGSTSGASVRQKRAKRAHALDSSARATVRSPTNASDPAAMSSAEHDEPEGADLVETPGIPVPDRIYLRVAMRDAVRGHRSLLVHGHVLHRDVRVNNVLVTLPVVPRVRFERRRRWWQVAADKT
jgi:hypothetical protein